MQGPQWVGSGLRESLRFSTLPSCYAESNGRVRPRAEFCSEDESAAWSEGYGALSAKHTGRVMNETPSNWIECLNNNVALDNMFVGNVPALDSLVLAQLVVDQLGAVYVSLNFPDLPASSPPRWITRGCDSVQLRLSFYDLTQLSISGATNEGNLEVTAVFLPEQHFSISNPEFKLELVYGYVKADMYPFDSRVFEEPRGWYRR